MTDAEALERFRDEVESVARAYQTGNITVMDYTRRVVTLALALTLHEE